MAAGVSTAISSPRLWFPYHSNPEDSISAPVGNLLNQTDRLLEARHGGDLALQTAGAFPVGGPIQEGEHVCPDGRWGDVRRSEEEPSTGRKDEIADDMLIGPLGKDQQRQAPRQRAESGARATMADHH